MRRVIGAGFAVVLAAGAAWADERKFTYSYEAQVLPEGVWEFEQWATMRARRDSGVYRKLLLREEVEYGVTDRLTAALYLNWEYLAIRDVPGLENEHEVELEGASLEAKYKLTDPSVDLVGSLLYGEISVEDDEVEFEAKLVLSRILGDFVVAYNYIFEYEKKDGDEGWESEFVVSNTLGVSYRVVPGFNVGLEAVSHTDFEHSVSHSEHTACFVGPNVHAAVGGGWATLTFLRQVGDGGLELDGHEKYEIRLIVGFSF